MRFLQKLSTIFSAMPFAITACRKALIQQINASDQEISIAVYDELTFGLGSAANEAYWGLANEIAQGAMDKTFGYVHGEESKQNTSSGPKRPLLELPSEKSKRTLRAGDLIGW